MISLNPEATTLTALRSVYRAERRMTRAMAQLASGLRINSAADDPAGLVISEQFRAQIASLNQEIENVSATINKYQAVSAEALEVRSQLNDLRALAVGAANVATNSEAAQQAYQASAEAIVAAVNETITSADYNGRKTLDGSDEALVDLGVMPEVDFSTVEGVEQAITNIDDMIQSVDSGLVELGAVQKNELESSLNSLEVTRENLVSSESRLRDTDYGVAMSDFVSGMIQEKASLAMLAHSRISAETVVSLLSV